MVMVPIAEYRPDVSNLNRDMSSSILNVLCADGSYMPFPKLEPYTAALAAKPLNAFMARTLAGDIRIFAGTADKLWLLNNTTLAWADVSQALVTYGATESAPWSFAQFGPYVVAVNTNNDPQVFDLSTSTAFASLAGSPPRASSVRVWGDFLVLIGLASNPDRIHWSGLNNIEMWTPGTANSDFQQFPDGGRVQGATDATNPLIFQERAIRRATFVPGSVEVFTFQKIHEARGAKSPLSVATRGSFAFYADEGGLFQIGPDGALTPIGYEKVDRTIFQNVKASDIARMRGIVDPFYSRVYFAVDEAGLGDYDTFYVYDWNLTRWTKTEASIVLHIPAATPGQTLEGLADISASLDALPFSLDSRVWQGGAPVLAAFDRDNRLGFFSGSNARAVVTTQEMGDTGGQITTVMEQYPVVDTALLTCAVGSRFRRNDPVVWTNEQSPSFNTGTVKKRSRGRFHRFRSTIEEGALWSHFQGSDVKTITSGQR
ncbi:hypothetical protein [Microcystis phage Mae-JY35]